MQKKSVMGVLAILIVAVAGISVQAQEGLRETLFEGAKDTLVRANKAQAALLAPTSYSEGAEHYQRAESLLEKGGNIERIQSSLAKASLEWEKAIKATEIARISLSDAIQAREDAINAEAKNYAPEAWGEAQSRFAEATVRLEKGSLRAAERNGEKAVEKYREAELIAIKANYLNETKELLLRADKMKADRYAPNTFAKARALFAEAETELTQNRYDTDRPRSLAQNAKHEANLAIYLTENLTRVDRQRGELEQFLVDWQSPVKRIGALLDIPVYFDNGYAEPLQQLETEIEELLDTNRKQDQELQEKKSRIRDMENQIATLENRLGGASEERIALAAQLDQQARKRAKFASVEDMFSRDEAIVRRAGNDIILRMVGLTFASGESEINPDRYELLGKVRRAINEFSNSMIEVEGHTDSFGSDAKNLTLSTERAASVKAFMHDAMGLPESRVKAVGYGEARPIANNETPEGRLKNRRIDIIIRPAM
ncbi:MAG: OmpA family protein [Gammaproteobacteria bacterium]|nr:OmpA family protein [Gammaproteobacteria bacterium]